MATVSFIPESSQSISAMKAVIDYCLQQKKVADADSGRRLVSGVNCNGENAFTEFMATKTAHHKKGGMNFYHYVQSFSPSESVTAEQVHEIGLAFAKKAWPGHEVLVTTHTDTAHLHNHFVINSVHYESGRKLRQNPGTLTKLRALSDGICQQYGLSVLKPYKKDGANISSCEYRAAAKGDSWKFKLMSDIDFVMNRSGSRADFIREMQRLGYKVTWTDERKYITFTCPNGMKCRDIRLHDEKYLKGVLEYEFTIRKQLTAEHGNGNAEEGKRTDSIRIGKDSVSTAGVRNSDRAAGEGTQTVGGRSGISTETLSADREAGDGAVNFAFIGQFAETPRDTIFTTEYSMRTGMESVYTLLDIDRGVPEVWGSKYDVRELLRACYYAIDKKPITDIKLSFKEKMLLKVVMKKAKGTDVELLLKESGLIE